MPSTIDAIRDYFVNADPQAAAHVYPRQIAAQLKASHRATLKLLTEAMLRGDTILHWEMRCPVCGNVGHYAHSLRDARRQVACAACASTVVPKLDDDILVTFSVHPALRQLGPAADDPEFRRQMAAQYRPTSGHDMLSIPAFREWAQREPLPPGESLEVRRVAIWFSDLRRSTALYERRGDPYAFHLVREHFNSLFQAVDEAGGSVVKTLGDSVMAAFGSSAEALQGALDGHAAIARLNSQEDLSAEDCLKIKFGIHAGPSIVVTMNERLDYFGHTINLASRVTELVEDRDIALSEAVIDGPDVAEILAGFSVEKDQVPVKGLQDSLIVNRFRIQK